MMNRRLSISVLLGLLLLAGLSLPSRAEGCCDDTGAISCCCSSSNLNTGCKTALCSVSPHPQPVSLSGVFSVQLDLQTPLKLQKLRPHHDTEPEVVFPVLERGRPPKPTDLNKALLCLPPPNQV